MNRLRICFHACAIAGVIVGCNSSLEKQENPLNKPLAKNTYVGSVACQSCHTQAYADWTTSDHYLAMQPANDSTVLGDFDSTTYVADGVTNTFFKKGNKFYINTQGEDGNNHDYEVLYTFGYYPLQQYLIAFPGGRMQSTRVCWDTRSKKWFHQYAGQKIHYRDWLHWTGASQNWNTMCASCHTTDLQKNYDFKRDDYHTIWKELNVGCESCHGPGSAHISFVNSPEYKKGESIKNLGFLYVKDTLSHLQLNACAACHARKAELSQAKMHTGQIMDDLIPQIISNEFYFPDGQIKEEDYEYGSFTQSKMYQNNVRCSNCHNPHSGKLRMTGNNLCLSCHKPKYASEEHHFHAVNTEGSQCINCHMPVKTFMGNDHRRDHSFRIPRPDQSTVYGTPNTCTSCHKGKSPAWAADAIGKWYGKKRVYHFSDDLLPGSLLTDKSEKHLVKLLRDTLQPEIARATAAYYMGNIQTQLSATALLNALRDNKPLVRYHAVRSLENFPPEVWQKTAYQNLSDNVRAVRIAAADLYHRLLPEALPAEARSAYYAANAENREYLRYQTDFAIGNIMVADYELQGGDQLTAIAYYLRGLKKDSLMNYARFNLSAAYNSLGRNQEALRTLKNASDIDPTNDRIFYNMGLLYYELHDVPAAMENFQKAVRLGSQNPGVYYNYGLLLQQQGKMQESEKALLRGLSLNPKATNINYALAFFYMNQKDPQKARRYAAALRKIDPDNPEYQAMFNSLGL